MSTFKLAGMRELAERLTLKPARRADRTEEPREEPSPETSESPTSEPPPTSLDPPALDTSS